MSSPKHRQPLVERDVEAGSKHRHKMRHRNRSASQYDPATLASWSTLFRVAGSVLYEVALWRVVLQCVAVSLISALLVGVLPGMGNLGGAQIRHLGNIVRVLLGFILALYLSASLKRWWAAMTCLSRLFDSVKSLQLVLAATGAPLERLATVRRYAVLSAYILRHEVRTMFTSKQHEQDTWTSTVGQAMIRGWMNNEELQILNSKSVRPNHRSVMIWSWIGILVGESIADLVKAGQPPVGAKLDQLSGNALRATNKVKGSVAHQIPLTYVHTVAVLVHFNNILLALATGVLMGSQTQRAVQTDVGVQSNVGREEEEDFVRSVQRVVVAFFSLVINPLVYQSFLHIGACLNDPFSEESYGWPIHEYVDELEETLIEIDHLGSQEPNYKTPEKKPLDPATATLTPRAYT